jgi:hypothetical protein
MTLIPKNDKARVVLDHLPPSHVAIGGYHGGQTYCIGILVRDVGEAFELGKAMGAEATAFGAVGYDKQGNQTLVVFREALVRQGPVQN